MAKLFSVQACRSSIYQVPIRLVCALRPAVTIIPKQTRVPLFSETIAGRTIASCAKMSALPRNVIGAIQDHASAKGLRNPVMSVSNGSRNGDSFSGEVYRVVVTSGAKDHDGGDAITAGHLPKIISVIAKVAPKSQLRRSLYNSSAHFIREKYVFDTVLPAFEKFQRSRISKNASIFQHYPKAIASDCIEGQEFVLLEDLALHNFRNFQRTEPLGFENVRQILEKLAELHAISFAMKDQTPEVFQKLVAPLRETIFTTSMNAEFASFLKRQVDYTVDALKNNPADGDDVVNQKVIRFRDEYASTMVECVENREGAVLCHGDCWISNILYRPTSHKTKDLKFIDWQVVRHGSPVIDLSYFLFCCTDSKLRQRLPELLQAYHARLSRRISELGSHTGQQFPFSMLEQHMQKYARFGFGMALMTLHSTCCVAEDLPDVSAILEKTKLGDLDKYVKLQLDNPAYIKRVTGVCRDMVKLGYL